MMNENKSENKNNISYFETHCHLDSLKSLSIEAALKQAASCGVVKILTIGVEKANQKVVLELAQKYSKDFGLYCSLGIHPHDALSLQEDVSFLTEIESMILENPKHVLAFGEIGLDYHYNFSPPSVQKKVFEEQLNLAAKLNLPVVLHTREADDDMLAIMKNFAPFLKRKGVFHSYSSGVKLLEFALENGFYIGFNGMVTFAKADNVRNLLKMTPIERILFETDAPYLAPTPFRGKENAPHFIPHIASRIALEKGIQPQDNTNLNSFFSTIFNNSLRLFNNIV